MTKVSISELKSRLSAHLRAAEAGETIAVMDRARMIAKVVPVDRNIDQLDVVASTSTFASVRTVRVTPLPTNVRSLDLLREERGTR
jgi:antitoxin (DNA-binding transcriptional repressor) of toxin-antitoxin stability system